jgi:hypothetical protein
MNEVERRILDTLKEIDQAVQTIRTAVPKPNLVPLFERITTLRTQLPRETDPQLIHYLQKQSYEKARLYLEGRENENAAGSCPH